MVGLALGTETKVPLPQFRRRLGMFLSCWYSRYSIDDKLGLMKVLREEESWLASEDFFFSPRVAIKRGST